MTQTAQGPVVVGVDGSASASQAVRWAAREAGRRRAPLMLFHVWTPIAVAPWHVGSLRPYHDALVEQGGLWLREAAAAAREAAPGVITTTELASGSAARHLIDRSASDGPVVVGVDESPNSRAALDFAFLAAALRGVPLTAVHAWSDLPVTTVWELTTNWHSIQQDESEELSQWLADGKARYPDVSVEQVVVRDGPTHILLEHAKTAQLLVVGTRGRGGFRGLLLGSTSQAMIHHAACPVAVVPPSRP